MLWYALRRLLMAVPLLVGITFVSFLVLHLAPGDPVEHQAGELSVEVNPQARQMLRELYGLDQPLHVQYGRWLRRLVDFDFGRSFAPDGRPVLDKITERMPVTLALNLVEMAVILIAAIPIGVLSALILPIAVATFGGLAGFSRYMRQSMLEVVRQDYIQTARAKGLSEGLVVGKHALRNALLPVVTILGLSLPGLIGGSVIVESIFAIPGMGQLMVQAVFERDYPVIMGNLVIVSGLTLGANLVADLSYGLVDPRIRLAGRRGRR